MHGRGNAAADGVLICCDLSEEWTDIARGFRSDSFAFTVRNDSLAHVIETLSGKRVTVDYDQHINVPTSCFGETEYFVKGITVIPE